MTVLAGQTVSHALGRILHERALRGDEKLVFDVDKVLGHLDG